LEEAAPPDALRFRQRGTEVFETRFDFALLRGLGRREILLARDDLGRDRRGERGLRREQLAQVLRGQELHGI
jgi:hypothetical protein